MTEANATDLPDLDGVVWTPREQARQERIAPLLPRAERHAETQLAIELETRACDLWERVHPDEPNPMLEVAR